MGRKPRSSSTDGNGRDGPAILERLLGGALHSEVVDSRATAPPEQPAVLSTLGCIPAIFLLDASTSMFERGALGAVTRALPGFRQDILNDSLTARKLSWAVLTYAQTPTLLRAYGPIADWQPPAEIESRPWTAMATAILEMLRIQSQHVDRLAAQGRPIQHKFCFHVTDGEPTEPPERLDEAARLIAQAEDTGFSLFNLAVEGANLEVLKRLTPRRTPLRLADVKDFSRFFAWLNTSLRTTSHSMAGERVPLPSPMKSAENPIGWAEI